MRGLPGHYYCSTDFESIEAGDQTAGSPTWATCSNEHVPMVCGTGTCALHLAKGGAARRESLDLMARGAEFMTEP